MSLSALDSARRVRERASPALKKQFRIDIQGLRAVAVLLVVAYHAGVGFLSGGYIGVDVFFVISGFLITTHLLESLDRHGRIPLAQFYANRARRILPAAFTVLIVTIFASVIWVPPIQLKEMFQAAIATVLYAPNILFAVEGTNYLAETAPSIFQHYWSLGIEEQFYAFWPMLLGCGYWLCRRSEKTLFWIVAGVVTFSFVMCLLMMDRSQPWAFFSLPTRAWELGVGGLVAFLLRSRFSWLRSLWMGLLAWVGLLVLITVATTFDASTPFPSFYAAIPVLATAMMIIGGGAHSRLNATSILAWRPFQFIGLISYSLYLVHWPILVIPQAAAGLNNPLPVALTLALGVASVPVAYVLHKFVEDPARQAKFLANFRPRRTLLSALAGSTVIVLLVTTSMLIVDRQPLHSDQTAARTEVSLFPQGTSFVPSDLKPSLRSAVRDLPVIYEDGCHRDFDSTNADGCLFGSNSAAPRVALFGDSHAANWFPALLELANSGIILLDSHTKSSCPSVSMPTNLNGVSYAECQQWREKVIDRLNADVPDVLLIANYGHSPAETDSRRDSSLAEDWEAGLNETIAGVGDSTAVAVIADVPNMGATPAICLSAHLESASQCSQSRTEALNAEIRGAEQRSTEASGAAYLDFTDYFCNPDSCPAIISNLLVYRDAHHLTASFGREMAPVIGKQLKDIVAEKGS